MKKAISSDLVNYLYEIINASPGLKVKHQFVDIQMENSHVAVTLENGLKIKIKQNEKNIERARLYR